ncbi:F-box domain containing protein [Hordeum vulgare]|nr:F-box domain containing protein [Hordeum vulgare]
MRGKKRALSPPAVADDATARLQDRHLAEILLRLPSSASLARAAAVSRRWRRISASSAFLRQFRRRHPAQLVGFFICNGGFHVERAGGRLIGHILDPTFLPVLPPPRGVGSASHRCIDFSLRRVPDVDHRTLADARDGLLLLSSTFDDRMNIPHNFVICDPLSRRSVLMQKQNAPTYQLDQESAYLGAALIVVDGVAGSSTLSFEVILVTYFMFGPRLCVFSSLTGQWSVLPEAKCGKSLMPMLSGVGDPAHANGCVYWVMDDESEAYLLVLDTRTKEFSTSIRLLASMREQYDGNTRVMRSQDGELRIVAMAWRALSLHIWHLDRSRSRKGR